MADCGDGNWRDCHMVVAAMVEAAAMKEKVAKQGPRSCDPTQNLVHLGENPKDYAVFFFFPSLAFHSLFFYLLLVPSQLFLQPLPPATTALCQPLFDYPMMTFFFLSQFCLLPSFQTNFTIFLPALRLCLFPFQSNFTIVSNKH